MGRYYNTQNFNGKFGFGCQSSYDPEEVFGMYPEQTVKFYLDSNKENLERVKKAINEQYDLLDVPNDKRLYEVRSDQELYDYIDSDWFDEYVFRIVDDEERKRSHETYALGNGKSAVERVDNSFLAKCRISLGVRIYSELLHEGWCDLEGEV